MWPAVALAGVRVFFPLAECLRGSRCDGSQGPGRSEPLWVPSDRGDGNTELALLRSTSHTSLK